MRDHEAPAASFLQQAKAVYERVHGTSALLVTSMVLANTVDRSALVVHADDPWSKQAELSGPSAWPAPSLGHWGRTANVGTQAAATVLSVECARTTTSAGGLVGTAATAQVAACGADAIVERTGWLTQAERAQEDVGFSAIGVAWFIKFLFDKAKESKDHGQRWLVGAGAFAGTVAVGLPLYEGSQGGKLDAVSHTTALAIGFLAHKLSERKKLSRVVSASI